ncbi:MAG: hypothetical protein RRY15_07250, partial [Bacteroidales bacterium]
MYYAYPTTGGGFDVGDGNYTGTGALSYKVSGNEIHGSAAGILRIDTVWKSNIASPSDYMYYYNGPSTGQQTIINSGRMTTSYESYPYGGIDNQSGGWFLERFYAGTPHEINSYKDFGAWSGSQSISNLYRLGFYEFGGITTVKG